MPVFPRDADELPEPHRVIRVTRSDDPVSVLTDTEAWEARDAYPDIVGQGPLFAVTEQEPDGRWRVLLIDEAAPQGCRDALASVCRRRAAAAREAGDEAGYRAWMGGAHTMESEKTDDLTVRDCRFRIARGDMFARLGPDGPEPPRPSDPDPLPIGGSGRSRPRSEGFLIDPTAATGVSEGLLRVDLLRFVYPRRGVPADVYADSVRARRTHPGGVLLPTGFTVSERRNGRWSPETIICHDTPQESRDQLADFFEMLLPAELRPRLPGHRPAPELPQQVIDHIARQRRLLEPGEPTLTRRQLRDCADALVRLRSARLDTIEALGRCYRVTRIERLVRLGPDGPEPPRPSDWDPEDPVNVQAARDRANGIVDE
ncbi:DUF5954 family protein [Streptomyces sp. 7-21]|uniref:DUF5954 family protein n=1 Tax=Streptomyces sp. 7-21 TaxID=2802283 RepID=UPI00191F4440|nr:DUF5954 family protein [Streptomyces sp. 7-21]MBL1069069.1 PE-PGRS family protein [Streptomyces sp. 7-21]